MGGARNPAERSMDGAPNSTSAHCRWRAPSCSHPKRRFGPSRNSGPPPTFGPGRRFPRGGRSSWLAVRPRRPGAGELQLAAPLLRPTSPAQSAMGNAGWGGFASIRAQPGVDDDRDLQRPAYGAVWQGHRSFPHHDSWSKGLVTLGKATGRSLDANLDWLVIAQSTRSRPPPDGSGPTGSGGIRAQPQLSQTCPRWNAVGHTTTGGRDD